MKAADQRAEQNRDAKSGQRGGAGFGHFGHLDIEGEGALVSPRDPCGGRKFLRLRSQHAQAVLIHHDICTGEGGDDTKPIGIAGLEEWVNDRGQ